MGRISLFLLISVALTSAACQLKPEPSAVVAAQPGVTIGAGDRTDCGQIFGTSFRSTTEREWFEKNCTQWPFFNPTETPASIAGYVPTQTCDQIRGKPYTSEGQHQWYLANCLGAPQAGQPAQAQPAQPQPNPGQPAPGQPVVAAGPDRTNCVEIRGTPYRSPNERNWYLANCVATPTPPPAVVPVPAPAPLAAAAPPQPAPPPVDAAPVGGVPPDPASLSGAPAHP